MRIKVVYRDEDYLCMVLAKKATGEDAWFIEESSYTTKRSETPGHLASSVALGDVCALFAFASGKLKSNEAGVSLVSITVFSEEARE